MILANYIKSLIFKNFLGVFIVLILIISGNQFFLVLKEAIELNVLTAEIFSLVFFKSLRDISTIFSISLFFSTLVSMSRLYRNSEIVVIKASGASDYFFIKILTPFMLWFFFINLILSLFIGPYAAKRTQDIRHEASQRPEFLTLMERQFQVFSNGKITIYSEEVENLEDFDQNLKNVFIKLNRHNEDSLIISQLGKKFLNQNTNEIFLRLTNGNLYRNLSQPGQNAEITSFEKFEFVLHNMDNGKNDLENKSFELSLSDLIDSDRVEYKSEIISRFIYPINLIILSFLAIILAEEKFRSANNLHYFEALFLVTIYLFLLEYFEKSLFLDPYLLLLGYFFIHLFFVLYTLLKCKIKN